MNPLEHISTGISELSEEVEAACQSLEEMRANPEKFKSILPWKDPVSEAEEKVDQVVKKLITLLPMVEDRLASDYGVIAAKDFTISLNNIVRTLNKVDAIKPELFAPFPVVRKTALSYYSPITGDASENKYVLAYITVKTDCDKLMEAEISNVASAACILKTNLSRGHPAMASVRPNLGQKYRIRLFEIDTGSPIFKCEKHFTIEIKAGVYLFSVLHDFRVLSNLKFKTFSS